MAAPEEDVSSAFRYMSNDASVRDSSMAYIDGGETTDKPTFLLIHGIPTSSYLWRNIIPHIPSAGYRCIAPDLNGMGHSGTLDINYRLADHIDYFDEFMHVVLPSGKLVIMGQDWGSALGLDWARRFPHRVEGLVLSTYINGQKGKSNHVVATWSLTG